MDSISPIKRHRLTDWIHKENSTFCCIQETYLSVKDRYYFRVKGWKTIFQANGPKKQPGKAILILNKTDFHPNVIERRDRHHGTSAHSGRIIQIHKCLPLVP
jgi:exonuclease III